MGIVYINLTEQCNKNCIYCSCNLEDEKNIEYSDKQIIELKKIFDLLQKINSIIFLGGGEPGIIKHSEIDKIFNLLSTCWVATNGEFVKNYYGLYKDKIDKIIYHVLTKDSIIYETPINDYVYIVHKKNIHTISEILSKFKNEIQLKLYNSINNENDPLLLDYNDIKIVLNYCKESEYKVDFIDHLKSYINIDNEKRSTILEQCRNILPTPGLVLSKNKISPCCRGNYLVNDSYPDITYNNFIDCIYLNKPVDGYGEVILNDIPCDGCNRLVNNENIFDNDSVKIHIKNKVKVYRITKDDSI